MGQFGSSDLDVVIAIGIVVVGEGSATSLEFEGVVLHPGGVVFAVVAVVSSVETTGFGEEVAAGGGVGVEGGRGGGDGE